MNGRTMKIQVHLGPTVAQAAQSEFSSKTTRNNNSSIRPKKSTHQS